MFIMETAIREAIQGVLKKLGIEPVDFAVEHPADLSHGDYATNVAMALSKRLGKNPRELAEQFCAELGGVLPEVVAIEIAGPGFINFRLSRNFFSDAVARVRTFGDAWGKNDSWAGKEVLVEYTSPNLFKPLHIGNLVGNIVGESLTRLLESAGATVKRLNYPSDIGLTVAKGVWGLRATGGNPRDIQALGEAYRYGNEAYETDEIKKAEIIAVNQALYAESDQELNQLRDWGILTSKERLLTICNSLGTKFDSFGTIFESDAAPKGIELVKQNMPRVFKESEGAIVYEGEKVGLHTRVFINSNGLPTYEAKDLGNFAIKQERFPEWTHSIVVTGNEQTEYFKVIYAAIKEIFPEIVQHEKTLEHIPTGFLTLTTGKMSSRKGNTLSGEQMLDELEKEALGRIKDNVRENELDVPLATKVATAAIKYQILRHNTGSNIVFDKERALSFEGDSGPYLQYTHARIISVLEKAKEAGVAPSVDYAPSVAYPIEKTLYRFEEVIREALVARAPHLVTTYLTELAGAFNTFYAGERIADATDEYAPYKAAVADAVRITLKNGLWTLGIKAPLKM